MDLIGRGGENMGGREKEKTGAFHHTVDMHIFLVTACTYTHLWDWELQLQLLHGF